MAILHCIYLALCTLSFLLAHCCFTMTLTLEDFYVNSDKKDLKDRNFDEMCNESDFFPSFNDSSASPLCVPQDPVEELEWYPSFGDDLILLCNLDLDSSLQSDFKFCDTPQKEKFETEAKGKRTLLSEQVETQKKSFCDQSNIQINQVYLSQVQSKPLERLINQSKPSFVKKKPRNKRECGRRAWSKSVVGFENSEPMRGFTKGGKRCSHCESKKTPQWRAGPLGPNTLCNACGVRYKSGRLLPEYRPAASPTFDGKKHSNFHKQILKKRGH